jgi:hypothetical protein
MEGEETQLSLFTRRKARKMPAAKEFDVHCVIADTLRLGLAPGWMWFHCPNGELRSKATAGRLKRMGVKPGVADFLLVGPPFATLHALELKRRGERPQDVQLAFLEAVTLTGGRSAWVDSFDGAMAVLRDWGAVKGNVR